MRKFAAIITGVSVTGVVIAFMVMLADGVRKIVLANGPTSDLVGQIFLAVFGIVATVFMANIAHHNTRR